MPTPLRHLAAIRTRLLASADITALVGATGVYVAHIFDITEPNYPCVTIRQLDGNRGVWAPRILDPANVLIECWGKGDTGYQDVITLDDLIVDLLHNDKTDVSSAQACFHEIRQVWSNSPIWDGDSNAWRQASRYLVRVSTS